MSKKIKGAQPRSERSPAQAGSPLKPAKAILACHQESLSLIAQDDGAALGVSAAEFGSPLGELPSKRQVEVLERCRSIYESLNQNAFELGQVLGPYIDSGKGSFIENILNEAENMGATEAAIDAFDRSFQWSSLPDGRKMGMAVLAARALPIMAKGGGHIHGPDCDHGDGGDVHVHGDHCGHDHQEPAREQGHGQSSVDDHQGHSGGDGHVHGQDCEHGHDDHDIEVWLGVDGFIPMSLDGLRLQISEALGIPSADVFIDPKPLGLREASFESARLLEVALRRQLAMIELGLPEEVRAQQMEQMSASIGLDWRAHSVSTCENTQWMGFFVSFAMSAQDIGSTDVLRASPRELLGCAWSSPAAMLAEAMGEQPSAPGALFSVGCQVNGSDVEIKCEGAGFSGPLECIRVAAGEEAIEIEKELSDAAKAGFGLSDTLMLVDTAMFSPEAISELQEGEIPQILVTIHDVGSGESCGFTFPAFSGWHANLAIDALVDAARSQLCQAGAAAKLEVGFVKSRNGPWLDEQGSLLFATPAGLAVLPSACGISEFAKGQASAMQASLLSDGPVQRAALAIAKAIGESPSGSIHIDDGMPARHYELGDGDFTLVSVVLPAEGASFGAAIPVSGHMQALEVGEELAEILGAILGFAQPSEPEGSFKLMPDPLGKLARDYRDGQGRFLFVTPNGLEALPLLDLELG